MAQRATGVLKKPKERASQAPRAGDEAADAPLHAIPFDLAPLIAPYKKRGRLAIRVEHMPLQARLSAGRNNGDNSWSLALDELEDLEFLAPGDSRDTHNLTIRIIANDGSDASTLAALDFRIGSDRAESRALPGKPQDAAPGVANDEQIQSLSAELATVKAELAAREAELAARTAELAANEAELANIRDKSEKTVGTAQATLKSELAKARAAWETEEAARLAKAEARWLDEANKAAAQAEKFKDDAVARARATAEAAWKKNEETRLAAAEARWRKQVEQAEADARIEAESVRKDSESKLRSLKGQMAGLEKTIAEREATLADVRRAAEQAEKERQQEAKRALSENETKLRDVRSEIADVRTKLAERDTTLAELRRTAEKADKDRQQEAKTALSESEAKLREMRGELAETRTKLAERDVSLAQLRLKFEEAEKDRQQAAPAAGSDDEEQTRVLREDLAAAKASLDERDATIARLRTKAEEARAEQKRAFETALAEAEAAWKAGETSRLVEAEARWKEENEGKLADLKAQYEADRPDTSAETTAAHKESEKALDRLREELATVQTALTDREAELAQLQASTRTSKDAAQDVEAAIAKAAAEWKTEEAARLAAAKAEWREHQDAQLSEATDRYEAAEASLAELRRRSGGGSFGGEAERLRGEISTLEAVLASRDSELGRMRETIARMSDDQNRARARRDAKDEAPKRGMGREIIAVMAIVMLAVLFYPQIIGYLPYSWQVDILGASSDDTAASDSDVPAKASAAASTATPAAKVQDVATITRGVNLRAGPGTTNAVVTTLKRGTEVVVTGQTGGWMHVREAAASGQKGPLEGWVYKTYLGPGH